MEDTYKCVSLKGEFSDFGNHILMPFGVTICGLPTVDASLKDFPQLSSPHLSDIISEYDEKDKWEITCEKCLTVFKMLEHANEKRKEQNN